MDNNDQTIIQNEDSIRNDVNVDVKTKKTGYAIAADQEKQICPVATIQEGRGRVLVIEPINAVRIRYAEPTKDGSDEQKEKRVRELSEALCSPYVKRKVSVTRELEDVEKPVVESIFTGRYNVGDIIFKTSNMKVQRVAFESMHEGFALTKSVIDVWSIIQNNDEHLKNKMRSKYLFCKTGMTTLEVDIIDNKKEESQDIVGGMGRFLKDWFTIGRKTTNKAIEWSSQKIPCKKC
uniref:Ulp1 protease family, C-terminal catalytic domain-containing protein n=1 Tax=Tanacetum cinerariifolium TaxID=118510 RepID=A0A6L2KSL3_TANCI|nr:ulp1 protease family, C-terminal catalytic domain-containing protein [Tanacetum cinerariifolium]